MQITELTYCTGSGILPRFHILGAGVARSQLRICCSVRLGTHLSQASTSSLENKSITPVITPKTTKYSSEKPLARREGHLETPQSKIGVRKVIQVLLQKEILQINYFFRCYLCQERPEQRVFEASSNLEFSGFNLSFLLLILALVKAVTDSDLPSWVFYTKVGQKYSLVRFLPRAEQNNPAVNGFNFFSFFKFTLRVYHLL